MHCIEKIDLERNGSDRTTRWAHEIMMGQKWICNGPPSGRLQEYGDEHIMALFIAIWIWTCAPFWRETDVTISNVMNVTLAMNLKLICHYLCGHALAIQKISGNFKFWRRSIIGNELHKIYFKFIARVIFITLLMVTSVALQKGAHVQIQRAINRAMICSSPCFHRHIYF